MTTNYLRGFSSQTQENLLPTQSKLWNYSFWLKKTYFCWHFGLIYGGQVTSVLLSLLKLLLGCFWESGNLTLLLVLWFWERAQKESIYSDLWNLSIRVKPIFLIIGLINIGLFFCKRVLVFSFWLTCICSMSFTSSISLVSFPNCNSEATLSDHLKIAQQDPCRVFCCSKSLF